MPSIPLAPGIASGAPDGLLQRARMLMDRVPFLQHFDVHLETCTIEGLTLAFKPRPDHLNSWGVVHGGVLMTLLDFSLAMAGRVGRMPDDPKQAVGNVTVEMKTSFLRPASGPLLITATCVQSGHSLSFCEGSVLNTSGGVTARASGTFKYFTRATRSTVSP